MNIYQQTIGRIQYYLFIVVVVSLPFPQIFLRYACVAWIITWALEGRWLRLSNLKSQLSKSKLHIPFLLFGLWYAYKLLSGLWAADTGAWESQMERYMTFALIVPVGLWGLNTYYDWKKIGRALVISCVCAVPIYVILFVVLYHCPQLVDMLNWKGEWDFTYPSWFPFFAENITVVKHRLYLCSVELFGAFVAYLLYRYQWKRFIPCLLILLSLIPLTASRQAILTITALVVVALIYLVPVKYRKLSAVGIIIVGIGVGWGLLKVHPRMQNFDAQTIGKLQEVSADHDVRLNIWGAALQHPEDYIVHGIGGGQSQEYMVQQYNDLGLVQCAQERYNCHNQYLEEIVEGGVIGLILFLVAWLAIPFCTPPHARQIAWLFVMLFICDMFTESVFGRFDGVALWVVGLLLIGIQAHAKREE